MARKRITIRDLVAACAERSGLERRPFIFILWTDAASDHGWDSDSGSCSIGPVWSAGFTLVCNAEQVVLAGDVSPEGGHNRRIAVPIACINEIRHGAMDGPLVWQAKRSK